MNFVILKRLGDKMLFNIHNRYAAKVVNCWLVRDFSEETSEVPTISCQLKNKGLNQLSEKIRDLCPNKFRFSPGNVTEIGLYRQYYSQY